MVCFATDFEPTMAQGHSDTVAPMDGNRSLLQPLPYLNESKYLVILKLIHADKVLLEKVLFPFEEWFFDAPVEAHVELWSNGLSGAELLDRFEAGSLANAL